MIKYKSFTFPVKYRNLSKDELFIEFINQNIFLMRSPTLYNQKMIDVLKSVVNKDDDNETTWWKFWLKTESTLAKVVSLDFLEDTIEKILENSSFYKNDELSHLILDFNTILVNMKKIEVFPCVEPNLNLFYDKNHIPESVSAFYKNRNLISRVLNKYIPDEAINKKMIKIVLGDYIIENISKINNTFIIKEFLYREAFHFGKLDENCVKNVCSKFINSKYRKSHPTIIKDIWNEIKEIYDKPEK